MSSDVVFEKTMVKFAVQLMTGFFREIGFTCEELAEGSGFSLERTQELLDEAVADGWTVAEERDDETYYSLSDELAAELLGC